MDEYKMVREIIVDYHLNAVLAVDNKIEHYPSIVETVNRILQELKEMGWVRVGKETSRLLQGDDNG